MARFIRTSTEFGESRLRGKLLARIGRRYRVMTEPMQIGNLRFIFTRLADPDGVLDDVAREQDLRIKLSGRKDIEPLHLPYWAELWESARGVGQFLIGQKSHLGDVLDLGCGQGLAGTVAAALGGKVTFADLESPALLLAALQQFAVGVARADNADRLAEDRIGETFDLIIGADILYEKQQWAFLEPFWRAHLRAGGVVLLGEPGRQTGDLFLEWISSRDWKIEKFVESVPNRARPIRVFRLSKK